MTLYVTAESCVGVDWIAVGQADVSVPSPRQALSRSPPQPPSFIPGTDLTPAWLLGTAVTRVWVCGGFEGGQWQSLGDPRRGGGGRGSRRGISSSSGLEGRLALHPLQLGLSEECLLSFTGKLGALGPWSPDSQPPGSPGSTALEWSASRLPLRGRVTVPYCCLAGRLSSGGFYNSSVGEGRGCKKPAGLPQTVPGLSNQTYSPKILKGSFQLSK